MVLTAEQVRDKLKERHENKNQKHWAAIQSLKDQHKELKMQVHGDKDEVREFLKKIEGLESESKLEVRKRLSRSNKDLWDDVLGPTNKIFSKQGGSKDYQLGEEDAKAFKDFLSTVNKGSSFTQWLKSFFIDKTVTDPNGLFVVEYKDKKPFPTYKSILTVADYLQNGLSVEYVIFEPVKIKEDKEIYRVRVYDDEGDNLYELDQSDWTIELIEDDSFDNPWGRVPAVLCSDIEDTVNLGYKQTPVYKQQEIAGEFLRMNSVCTLQYYHHGFLKFWKHGNPCAKCGGTGKVFDNSQYRAGDEAAVDTICPTCNGSRHTDKEDVSDVTYISIPSSGQTTIAPNVMGYVEMPVKSLEALDKKLKELRNEIFHSHWGMLIDRDDKDKTAFEVSLNTQPMQDRLDHYTDSLENIETHLVDLMGEFLYGGKYKGSSINYGRNYVIKGADQLLKDYQEAKSKKASYTILNEKLIKYYNALYSNDAKSLDMAIKLMKVEPFIHNTIDEAKTFAQGTPLFNRKVMYNEWLSTVSHEDLSKHSAEELKGMLSSFVSDTLGGSQKSAATPTKGGANIETPVDKEAEAKAALKGSVGGVQGILSIQASVVQGVTEYKAALKVLEEIYGFDESIGKEILGTEKQIQ